MAPLRKGYVDTRWGQLHYRTCAPPIVTQPALVCLHATAYSGRTFDPILTSLAVNRRVLALDTPGYGASDAPARRPTFTEYADVVFEAITALVGQESVDVFGYHTGALLATEMAAAHAEAVHRLVLIGIPFFEGEEKDAWRAKLVHQTVLDEDFDQFRDRWDYFVTQRTKGLSLARAFDCFVDELAVYPREWWAHDALFDYGATERLPLVTQQTLVVNPNSALAAASSRAARVMPNARVLDVPELTGAIFDLGAATVVSTIDGFLRG